MQFKHGCYSSEKVLMEIFGIGPLELILIFLLALVVLGPNRMIDSAKKGAGWLRKFRQSDAWKTTKEVMDIPSQVMKETGLEKEIRELNTLAQQTPPRSVWDGDMLSNAHPLPSASESTRTDPVEGSAQTTDSRADEKGKKNAA
jgi:sec-independent protein translocase protein TatB